MARLFAVLAVPALLLAVAPAAPVPKGTKRTAYFPTTKGTRWEVDYTPKGPGGPLPAVEVVLGVEDQGADKLVTVGTEAGGKVAESARWLVGDGGLFLLTSGGQEYAPPICMLKLPHVPGQTWVWEPVS